MMRQVIKRKNIARLNDKTEQNRAADQTYQDSIEKLTPEERDAVKNLWDKYKKERADFEEKYNIYSGQITSFQEQLHYLIDAKNSLNPHGPHITLNTLADDIGISEKTLSRYSNGHYAPSINVLIMICILLDLDIKTATPLLSTLGLCFSGTSRAHYAYMYLLDTYEGKGKAGKDKIKECNELLTGLHIDKKNQLYPRKGSHSEEEGAG